MAVHILEPVKGNLTHLGYFPGDDEIANELEVDITLVFVTDTGTTSEVTLKSGMSYPIGTDCDIYLKNFDLSSTTDKFKTRYVM